MAAQVYRFDQPQRFIAGTVGRPGERSFFLQARDATKLISVLLEKEQVSVLAERVDDMLDEILRRAGGLTTVPAVAPPELDDLDPLEQPIVEEFRVGAMTLRWDTDDEEVVVAAYAASDDDTEPPDDPDESDRDVMVVRLSGPAARAFVKRAQAVVGAGRPPCPLCSLPLDPAGHVCPRQNGYRRRD
ncbi:DUF3090 family protein [Jiangella alkaliphila]|uniref:Repeat protein (TIGR03847 family) n=1 Tax=Jiangella alkaliphila TaxID=419479 RepID=A0A1H2KTJ9_9ACTN|nr:DUF3090 family protein [Jiangella alkaliphila]SDU71706.1 conserved hypothetical protein [Jiangella alkaliphila]